jgi:hypothetical protein
MITITDATSILEQRLGRSGGIVAMSKGSYRRANPLHVVIFNGAVLVEGLGVVWHGDLDLSVDGVEDILSTLAMMADGRKVQVCSERYTNEEDMVVLRIKDATWTGYTDELSGDLKRLFDDRYFERDNHGRLMIIPESQESIVVRELARVAADRLSLTEGDLMTVKIDFPYLALAMAAKGTNKKVPNPLDVYLDTMIKFSELVGVKDLHLTAVLHADDMEVLDKAIRRRLKKAHGYMSDYTIDKELSWAMLQYGPRTFVKGGTPDCILLGEIRFIKPRE